MCISVKKILFFVVFTFISVVVYGQQVTKEQLLKLFYQAHVAQNENNRQEAIDAYIKILKLSPGLPDPYFQLGNIYAGMEDDMVAMKKACICYANYLKLKPEASEADVLKNKISYLTSKIQEQGRNLIVDTPIPVDAVTLPKNKNMSLPPVDKKKEDRKQIVKQEQDTAPVVESLPASPINNDLLGRWVSGMMADNGRELWILDILSVNNELWIQVNDSSYMKKNPLFANLSNWKAKGMADGDELVFVLKMEQRKKRETENINPFGSFGAIVSEMFEMDWNSLSNSVGDVGDSIPTESSDTLSAVSDPLSSGLLVVRTYKFRLKFDGSKLAGTLQTYVMDAMQNNKVLEDSEQNIDLFKAPDGYSGFTFTPLSEELKATKKEFRDLLNQKMQESMENVSALNDLGCLYASGIGIRRNIKMAVAYFMEASMKNNLFGMLNMAQLYLEGLGVDKNLEKARELYLRAYESGYTDAMVLCGDSYLEGTAEIEPDYQKAVACYQRAVLRHCPYAAYRLGWLYNEGLGVSQDLQKAWEYYQQAISMQYPDAMTDVGIFYKEGNIVGQDYAKAMEYLMKAVNKGNARAMYELSQMYLEGEGVGQDFKLAKEWLYKSMEANDKIIDGYSSLKSRINAILHPVKGH